MTTLRRRLTVLGTMTVAIALLAGCTPATPSAKPSSAPSSSPSASSSPPPSAAPTATGTASAPAATPSEGPSTRASSSPTASASAAVACPVASSSGRLVSDRLTNVVLSSTATSDVVTFVFGNPSIGNPGGPPQGSIEAASPPYTEAASGLPVELHGAHVAQVRFSGMSLSNDAGDLTYTGDPKFRPNMAALRDVVNMDMSEGVVGWYVAWDGPGCVTLASAARSVTLTIAHR